MLIGVAALAVWELAGHPRTRAAVRRVLMLGLPFVVYGLWVGFIYIRLGTLPYGTSAARLGLPGVGLASAVRQAANPTSVLAGATAAALVTVVAVAIAHDDLLTWLTVGFAGFATLLGPAVWTTDGLVRTLLPLYALGGAAILGGCAQLVRRGAQVRRRPAGLGPLAGADVGRR